MKTNMLYREICLIVGLAIFSMSSYAQFVGISNSASFTPIYLLHVYDYTNALNTTTMANFQSGSTFTSGNALSINSASTGITTGSLLNITSTGALSTANSSYLAYLSSSGANTAAHTTYGLFSSITNSTGTNYAGYFSASGATNNYAIVVPAASGFVGIGTITPTYQLHVLGAAGNNNGVIYGTNNGGPYGYIGSSANGVYGTYDGAIYGSLGTASYGAYGTSNGTIMGYLGSASYGAYGQQTANIWGCLGSTTYGAYGTYNGASGPYGYLGSSGNGVYGTYDGTIYGMLGNSAYGAYGKHDANHYGYIGGSDRGVHGYVNGGGTEYGLYGWANGTGTAEYGVYGLANAAATTNYAGYFSATGAGTNYGIYVNSGKVNIQGLTASNFVKTDASKNLISQSKIDLTTDVTNTLAVGNGGTGLTAVGGNGTYLGSNGSTLSWSTPTTSLSGGTTNYLARWTSATTLGIGVTQDNGTSVGICTSPNAGYALYVNWNSASQAQIYASYSGSNNIYGIIGQAYAGCYGYNQFPQSGSTPSPTGVYAGVLGCDKGTAGYTYHYGVVGCGGSPSTANTGGVLGAYSGNTWGALGYVNAANTMSGVYGTVANTGCTLYGVYGSATGTATNYGVYGTASGGTTNWSGYFVGAGYLSVAAWTYGCDRRLKENIVSLNKGLNEILKLKPMRFDYIKGEKNQLGFIAQDVQEVLPELVVTKSDGYLGLKTDEIIPVLVNAMQEQNTMIDSLKSVIGNLQSSISSLQTKNENLKAQFNIKLNSQQAEIEKIKQQMGMEAKK